MTVGRCLLLIGFICLVIVVLTHVAEKAPRVSRYGLGPTG